MHLSRTRRVATTLTSPVAVWAVAASFYLVALFHRMSLGVASLDASRRFDLEPGTIATLSALQLGLYLVMTIPAGLAADRVGPRATLAAGLALMAAGEIAFGVATGAPVALAGRALVGVGDAFMFLSVLRIAQNWFPARRYALFASLTGLAGALGQIGTTVPLGLALDGAGWTATFVGSGVLTALLVVACLRLVADHPSGAAAAAGPVPTAPPVLATLRATWARPATRHAFWAHFGLMGPFVAITALWGYPYLVQTRGMDPGPARLWLLLTVAAFGAAAPLAGALVSRRPGLRDGLMTGVAGTATALWALTLLWPGSAPDAVVLATLLATGAGGATAMLAFDVARAGNPAATSGAATGLTNTGGFVAAVGTQLLVGGVLILHPAGGLRTALLPMLALMVLAWIRTVLARRRAVRAQAPAGGWHPAPVPAR
jgi:predicted MFS family arabinose efflux permease